MLSPLIYLNYYYFFLLIESIQKHFRVLNTRLAVTRNTENSRECEQLRWYVRLQKPRLKQWEVYLVCQISCIFACVTRWFAREHKCLNFCCKPSAVIIHVFSLAFLGKYHFFSVFMCKVDDRCTWK